MAVISLILTHSVFGYVVLYFEQRASVIRVTLFCSLTPIGAIAKVVNLHRRYIERLKVIILEIVFLMLEISYLNLSSFQFVQNSQDNVNVHNCFLILPNCNVNIREFNFYIANI